MIKLTGNAFKYSLFLWLLTFAVSAIQADDFFWNCVSGTFDDIACWGGGGVPDTSDDAFWGINEATTIFTQDARTHAAQIDNGTVYWNLNDNRYIIDTTLTINGNGALSMSSGEVQANRMIAFGQFSLNGGSLVVTDFDASQDSFNFNNGQLTILGSYNDGSNDLVINGATATDNPMLILSNSAMIDTRNIELGGNQGRQGSLQIISEDSMLSSDTLSVGGTTSGVGGSGLLVVDDGQVIVNGTFNVWKDGIVTVNGGNIVIGNNLNLRGDMLIDGGTLQVAGDLDLRSSGRLTINPSQTIHINGDYSQQIGASTLVIGVKSQLQQGQFVPVFGVVEVDGMATLSTGRVHVLLLSDDDEESQNANLQAGDRLEGILLASDLMIDSDFEITTNSGLLGFAIDFDTIQTGRLDLVAFIAEFIETLVQEAGLDYALGAAKAMDTILVSGSSGDMNIVVGALNDLDSAQVAPAVAQFVPILVGQTAQATKQTITEMTGAINDRIGMRRTWPSTNSFVNDSQLISESQFWVKPIAILTRQSDANGVPGYDATSVGVMMGADQSSDEWLFGIAAGYIRADIDGNTINTNHITVNGLQLALYSSFRPEESPQDFADMIALVGLNNNQSKRAIDYSDINRQADGDYHSWYARLYMGIGRDHALTQSLLLTYMVSVGYTYVGEGDYTETGAGALNLNVQSNSADSLVSAIDTIVAYHFNNDRVILKGRAGVGYDWFTDTPSVTARYIGGGDTFVTRGIEPGAWLYRAGATAEVKVTERLTIDANYEYQGASDFHNQIITADIRWAF